MADDSPKRKHCQHKVIGHLGVDAGLMYLGDPCYIPKIITENWDEFLAQHITEKSAIVKDAAWSVDRRGPSVDESIDFGVVVSSGMGDGIYPVVATICDGRIVRITIDFDPYDVMTKLPK